MHSARAGPVALEQVAASMPPFLVMAMVPPGQVTEISFSSGLQVRSQLLLWPQPSWRSACRPLEPGAPGCPAGPIGPASPLTPCGPCGPASPCGPGGPCAPSKQPASANAATRATIDSDARMENPLKPVSGNENVSPSYHGVNLRPICVAPWLKRGGACDNSAAAWRGMPSSSSMIHDNYQMRSRLNSSGHSQNRPVWLT
jgi:hypothetical protein